MNVQSFQCQKLISAALEHLALERAAACVLLVPDTDPPLFVAVGPAPAIEKLLQADVDVDRAVDAGDIIGHARALRRKTLEQKHAALQELVDIAQENDMGYGAPEKAPADVEFDESEGGHHD